MTTESLSLAADSLAETVSKTTGNDSSEED